VYGVYGPPLFLYDQCAKYDKNMQNMDSPLFLFAENVYVYTKRRYFNLIPCLPAEDRQGIKYFEYAE
jgi:hypothetical protein